MGVCGRRGEEVVREHKIIAYTVSVLLDTIYAIT